MDNKKEIEIYARDKTFTDKSGVEKTFTAYLAKQKDGKFMNVSFTKAAGNPKTKSGRFIIVVNPEQCNISKSGAYPKLWVSDTEYSVKEVASTTVDELNEIF